VLVVVLVIRFLVELALFAGAAVAASHIVSGGIGRVLFAVAGLVAIVAFWSAFLAPKRPLRISLPVRVILEVSLFVLVAIGLWWAGLVWAAIALVSAEALALGALFALGEEPGRHYDLSTTA